MVLRVFLEVRANSLSLLDRSERFQRISHLELFLRAKGLRHCVIFSLGQGSQ